MAKNSEEKWDLQIPVHTNGLSFGTGTARMSIKFSRGDVPLSQVDKFMNGSQCSIRLEHESKQGVLDGMEDKPLAAVVDIKQFTVNGDVFSASITFTASAVSPEALVGFVQKEVRLSLLRTGAAGVESEPE